MRSLSDDKDLCVERLVGIGIRYGVIMICDYYLPISAAFIAIAFDMFKTARLASYAL